MSVVCTKELLGLAVRYITELAIVASKSYHVPEFRETTMGEKERPTGANHSEQADRIQDSMPPVSSAHASTRNDERVFMRPHAETEVFVREQHSSQTQSAAPEREASSVDLREYRRLKNENDNLTEEVNDLRYEITQLRAEIQELKEQEEQRKKQNRKAYERYVQKDPEAYRAKKREEMRQRRAAQKK